MAGKYAYRLVASKRGRAWPVTFRDGTTHVFRNSEVFRTDHDLSSMSNLLERVDGGAPNTAPTVTVSSAPRPNPAARATPTRPIPPRPPVSNRPGVVMDRSTGQANVRAAAPPVAEIEYIDPKDDFRGPREAVDVGEFVRSGGDAASIPSAERVSGNAPLPESNESTDDDSDEEVHEGMAQMSAEEPSAASAARSLKRIGRRRG